MNTAFGIIILAAGKGTRMKSSKAKVLHTLAGRPLIDHVIATAGLLVDEKHVVVVVGHQADQVKEVAGCRFSGRFAFQKEQKGTGHAVQCALPELPAACHDVVILSGDVPLIRKTTIEKLIADHKRQGNDVTILGVCLQNPHGYGRLVQNQSGDVEKIVEEADATESEKRIQNVNAGIYCVNTLFLEESLAAAMPDNNQNEIYLTDIVAIARRSQKKIGLNICENPGEVMGVNTLQDLLNLESMLNS